MAAQRRMFWSSPVWRAARARGPVAARTALVPPAPGPLRLLAGVSAGALVLGLAVTPAQAQLSRMRANAGTIATVSAGTVTTATPVRPVTMTEALARQQALMSQAATIAAYVKSAKAAISSIPGAASVTDGISDKGLNPIAAVRAAANAAIVSGQTQAVPTSVAAASDTTGLNTWAGAGVPVQTTANGTTTVTITQTQQNALLDWQNFDVGANTKLVFSQKVNGVGQTSWTVVNRVINATGASKILGTIVADGTVLILNGKGVIFGPNAQVSTNALIASSLEIGNFASAVTTVGQTEYFVASTLADRDNDYLQNGLLVAGVGTFKGQLLSGILAPGTYNVNAMLPDPAELEGAVTVTAGAQITAGTGGYIILAGPTVTNAGILTATNGQVILQGGRYIGAEESTGGSGSINANVRGLILNTQLPGVPTTPQPFTPDQGDVVNTGYIYSQRGYISLGTGVWGQVTNSGLLEATTSVSRNGDITLTGGTVTLTGNADPTLAAGIEILPDSDGETIPQSSASTFLTSQVVIGDAITSYLSSSTSGDVTLTPSVFAMGQNAFIFAPSGKVTIGQDASAGAFAAQSGVIASVSIASGAQINVAGMMGVDLAATANQVEIVDAKGNELQDTPNYRALSSDGSFTLNGANIYIDPRVSGVRADGVAWVGSPLVDGAATVQSTAVSAAWLMTKGGTISIDAGALTGSTNLVASSVPRIDIASGAVLDVSGGWVTYDAGYTLSSELITSAGTIVNIANADPNGDYVAIVNGFTETQARYGSSQVYYNAALAGQHYNAAYDEGRDAGALQVVGSEIQFDGTVHANAFAGSAQLAAAITPTASSTIGGDPRKLQASAYQLPSGGLFRIGSFSGSSSIALGQDIVVYGGTRGTADANPAELLLDANMLSNAGLSGLLLQTSGAVTLTGAGDTTLEDPTQLVLSGASDLTLASGGTLEIDAGRSVKLDGNVRIADGTIAVRTYELSSVLAAGIGTVGNPFLTTDDIAAAYASNTGLPADFNITVAGTLDVSGLWTNDDLGLANPQGAAWINGGSISLTVAPKVFAPLGASAATATAAVDLSGSILIGGGGTLDATAGGYVSTARKLTLTGTGGNVSLIDQTTYAGVAALQPVTADSQGFTFPGQTVAFTPVAATASSEGIIPTLTPVSENSVVSFNVGAIKAYGFAGGGTFTLVSPDIAIGGARADANATAIPLDFLAQTGFGTLNLTAYNAQIVSNLFDNASTGSSAFFDTTRFVIGAGQTLNLTQTVLPQQLTASQQQVLTTLPSGSHLESLVADGTLTPGIPTSAYLQKAANLVLNGLMELDVEAGGTLTGAAQASVTTPKLYNAGTIDLPGGTISQIATLPQALVEDGYGLTDSGSLFADLAQVLGATNTAGQYQLGATNTAGLTNPDGSPQTNEQLFTTPGSEHFLYALGQVGANEGIVLTAGSVTNLAGEVLYNPNAATLSGGTQLRTGKIIDGGSITTAAAYDPTTNTAAALFPNPRFGYSSYPDPTSTSPTPPPELAWTAPRSFVAQAGSIIDIGGASGTFDVATASGTYVSTLEWSNGGTIGLLSGGNLTGATIRAAGGNVAATGGTLEWLDPTLRASATTGTDTGNVAYADQIQTAGFSTLIATGGLTLDGRFTLTLNKSLLVQSAAALTDDTISTNPYVTISATAGTDATIAAPYIGFSGRTGSISGNTALTGDAKVTFAAGASGIDLSGGILFDGSIAGVNLDAVGDVRLIGIDDTDSTQAQPVLNGTLAAAGNLTFDAARLYTTTGTGNLQRLLEDAAGATDTNPPSPYVLEALNGSTLTILGDHMSTVTPESAGSYLEILAGNVVQDGYLAAPLGRLVFGTTAAPVASVTLGAGSVTSVSGAGLDVPYGTTTDLTEYYFTPGTSSPLTQLPSGDLEITGTTIDVAKGATVDGAGGGDVYAYEFVSGTGGSRDVLSRFNSSADTANSYNATTGTGYQLPGGQQVYALVPAAQAAKIAYYDPIYSADYNGTDKTSPTNLYGTQAGLSVTLDGGNGIAAGQYVLMPAHYALLPGAYRVVENTGAAAPVAGTTQTLRDGSIVMGGTYSTAGTALTSSQRLSFTIQSQATFLKYSSIKTTSGDTTIATQAADAGISTPPLPLDAARVVLDPLTALTVAGTFDMTPVSGGRGSQVDILGSDITIDRFGTGTGTGLYISNATIANLDANSLLIGGQRTDNANDTTTIGVTASKITVAAGAVISVPELILAVGGVGSAITIEGARTNTITAADGTTTTTTVAGAQLTATGTLDDSRAGAYVIASSSSTTTGFDQSGVGALLAISSGPQRLVTRTGTLVATNAAKPTRLNIAGGTITGASLLLDTTHTVTLSDTATIAATSIALGASDISFGTNATIDPTLAATLAGASNLTLFSSKSIGFDAGSTLAFNNLTIDAPGLALNASTRTPVSVTIDATTLRLGNSSSNSLACGATGAPLCGIAGNTLNLNAGTITFTSGTFDTYGFDGAVNLTATNGAYYEGAGTLALNGAALTLTTPFLIDRAAIVNPNAASPTPSDAITGIGDYTIPVTPYYLFATTGAIGLTSAGTTTGTTAAGIRAPGATLEFGTATAPIASLGIAGTAVTATAGVIDAEVTGNIALTGGGSLSTPGTTRSFGDSQSTTTVAAGGGTVNLVSFTGGIDLARGTTVTVDNGVGSAGTLNLLAAEGGIGFDATLDPGVTGARTASLTFDALTSPFDLTAWAGTYGTLFEGALSIRAGQGDLTLAAGQTLTASSVSLTADGGSIAIAGTISTAGTDITGLTTAQAAAARVDGGNIALWAADAITLAGGSLLDTHTDGYALSDTRQASAGNVTLGIGTNGGFIAIDANATLNLSAARILTAQANGQTGARFVAKTVENAQTLVNQTVYDYVAADSGGTLTLSAPTIANDTQVDVRLHGNVIGAAAQQIVGYKVYNLDQLAQSIYDGVFATATGVSIETSQTLGIYQGANGNVLSDYFVGPDGTKSIPYFIQNFAISAADGSSLNGWSTAPGIHLTTTGTIELDSNWNLGAGTLNTAAALAAGYIKAIPELGLDANGNPFYDVVSGSEGALLANDVSFLYRVGGVATGAAPVITMDAGGAVDLKGAITDGFFTFADKSDPTWINYQLGGGNRVYDAALLLTCGTGADCSAIADYGTTGNTVTISLNKFYTGLQEGAVLVDAPYDALANTPDATGDNTSTQTGASNGDPLGFAQLFPLLPGGQAMQSSSYVIAAGVGADASVNPLHVDRATNAAFTLEGTSSYTLTATPGIDSLGTGLDVKLGLAGVATASDPNFTLGGLIGTANTIGHVNDLTATASTTITWANFASQPQWTAAATAWFAANEPAGSYNFTTDAHGTITGVAAPLGAMLGFLAAVAPDAAKWTRLGGSITGPTITSYGSQVAYDNSLIRTGGGAIGIAAAGNIDLTNGAVTYRTDKNATVGAKSSTGAQVGGTAIYTAGVRVSDAALVGNAVVDGALTGTVLSVTPTSPYQTIAAQNASFIPSPKGLDDQAGVLATGGGDLVLSAGASVLGRSDVWSQAFLGAGGTANSGAVSTYDSSQIGDSTQRWRVGTVGADTEIAIAPLYFTSGVGALAGGDVTIQSGSDVTDLTVALDAAATTTAGTTTGTGAGATMITLGAGNLTETIAGNLRAGTIDVADGVGTIAVAGSVVGYGTQYQSTNTDKTGYLQVRVADAAVSIDATGSITFAGVSALGAADGASTTSQYNQAGFYAADAAFSAVATGDITYVDNRPGQTVPFQIGAGNGGAFGGSVLPPSVTLAALTGTLTAPADEPLLLYPSATGNLVLYSAGNISNLVIAMSDADPSLLPGAFTAASVNIDSSNNSGAGNVTPVTGLGFGIPGVDATTSAALLRLYHNQNLTHAADTSSIVIAAGNDITNSLINVPKQAQIFAGRDIVDLYFTGQNNTAADTTIVSAGRDITGQTAASLTANLPYVISNDFTLGGPGAFDISAGRNLGPFINSAVVNDVSYAGGIQTVGNLYNPWLASTGADLTVLFGVANGVNYAGLRDAYLDPANFASLDGALFVQTTDALGNNQPDRSRQIYAPVLATWLRGNDPTAFKAIFGADALTAYTDTTAGNAALTSAAYGQMPAMYTAFTALPALVQDQFLIQDVYFNELAQAAEPTSVSYGQYYRGYRAVDILFPPSAGYTDNMSAYTTPASSVSTTHPQGVPVRNLIDGQPAKATQIVTGNADLRLATIETEQGGDINILGPGGTFIDGSVVRTSTQASNRVTRFGVAANASLIYGQLTNANVNAISAIPIGYEGILTLRGGDINAFTDGSFLVNQSRVFTEAGGNIEMWSSNGDLNAGQGPRSASDFPPVTVSFDLNGSDYVDSAGSVSGAGIGAFKSSPSDPASTVILIAPAGLVDAGDAGVRASGDILVAAAHVANADAFSAGGSIGGVAARGGAVSTAAPEGSNSAVAASQAAGSNDNNATPKSTITIDIDGYLGVSCQDPNDPSCAAGA